MTQETKFATALKSLPQMPPEAAAAAFARALKKRPAFGIEGFENKQNWLPGPPGLGNRGQRGSGA